MRPPTTRLLLPAYRVRTVPARQQRAPGRQASMSSSMHRIVEKPSAAEATRARFLLPDMSRGPAAPTRKSKCRRPSTPRPERIDSAAASVKW